MLRLFVSDSAKQEMIRTYIIEDYKDLYPELKSSALTDRISLDILKEEGIEDPEIHRTENGKPYEARRRIFFSISHSGRFFSCAVCEYQVGIDIQTRGPEDPEKIAERFFTEEEKDYIRSADGDIAAPFLRIWTRKEALIKFRGSTLAEVVSSTSVLSVDDVDFIDLELENGTIGCLCIPAGQEEDVRIIRRKAIRGQDGC